jgi:hypothetical protein
MFFVLLFLSYSVRKKIKILCVSGLIGCLTVITLSSTVAPDKLYAFSGNIAFWSEKKSDNVGIHGSSVSARKLQLESTIDILSKGYLFFGLGYGLATIANLTDTAIPVDLSNLYGFESIIFKKLIEQGFCGLFFFMLFFFQIYLFIRRQACIFDKKHRFVFDGFFLSYLAAIAVTGIQSTFYLFFLAGIVYLKYLMQLSNKKLK